MRLKVGLPVPVKRYAAEVVGPIPEWNVGAIDDVVEEDVCIELNCIYKVVAGTLLETEVTGMDIAICTDVRDAGTLLEIIVTGIDHVVCAGGGTYVATSSNWLLKYAMSRSQSLSWICRPLCAHQGT